MTSAPAASTGKVRLGQLGALVGHVSWLLGRRRRWLLLEPVLGVLGSAAEVVTLLSIVRSLLLLASGNSTAVLSAGGMTISLSFNGLLVVATGAAIVSMVIRSAESVLLGRLSALATARARSEVIQSYFTADLQQLDRFRSGRLSHLLGQSAQAASTAVPTLGSTVSAIVSLVTYGIAIFVSSPVIGALFIVLGAIATGAFSIFRKTMRQTARSAMTTARELQLSAASFSGLNREIHAFGVEDRAIGRLERLNLEARRHLRRLRTFQRLLPALFQQTVLILVIVVIVVARSLDVDTNAFGAAAILAVRSLSFVQQLNSAMQSFAEVEPHVQLLREAIAEHREHRVAEGVIELDSVRSLEFKSVFFSYEPGVPVLKDVDFRAAPGEWIGLVGSSGGGKSTIIDLVAGLLRPLSGEVLVNGRLISDYTRRSRTRRIALVSQEPALLRGTARENVAFLRDIDPDEIRLAARRAAIERELDGLPLGFDTDLGEGEGGLSGGQKQRLALARALAWNPEVLVLDEPTSALDATSEQSVERALLELSGSPIVIVASHRPALLRRCHRILRIEDGRVVDRTDNYPAAAAWMAAKGEVG